ncbi:hypothetical protein [Microbulbifer elongatus]|uniref:hypothetical protein n=1 Tax=Microbulbifer elongatus TaxID=86173 RepID=UPI001E3A24D8|nr:hypothetical protein [Microbulbifer elongatus]
MQIKRYGGKFGGGNDSGNNKIAKIGFYLFVASVFATIFFANPAFIIGGLLVLFLFTGIGMLVKGGESAGLREERYKQHLEDAERLFKEGDYLGASEAFRRAKIYGEIPTELQEMYTEVQLPNKHGQ